MSDDLNIEYTTRNVIEGKLLEALGREDCVAILASSKDLDLLIQGLGHLDHSARARELKAAFFKLRKEAFQ